jgi:regulator of protease activity HflC (stomatin/prohibitin superfamily)
MFNKIIGGVVGVFLLVIMLGSWYQIDEGERGVITRYGKVVYIAVPGLGFKAPFLDKVMKVSVQDHVEIYQDMETYSRDQQPATMSLSVSYRIIADKVDEIYATYGGQRGLVDRLITRRVFEQSKTVFGSFNAESAIRDRARLNSEIRESIQKVVDGPVIIVGVQIEDISFSSVYEKSVEERMLAEVSVQREKQNLEKEKVQADIVRTQALGAADQVRFAADAESHAIRARGNAEAEAITARAKALSSNAALIELVKAERWDGKLPTTMLPDAAMPFIGK